MNPLVGIVMGSDSDWPVMQAAAAMLKEFGVPFEAKVDSAHRTPDLLCDYAAMELASGEGRLRIPLITCTARAYQKLPEDREFSLKNSV